MASSSTPNPDYAALTAALGKLPSKFRKRVAESYTEIKHRYSQALHSHEYDATGISTGKFAETVLRLLQQEAAGTHTPFGKHIPNFGNECRKVIQAPATALPEPLRVIVPRALVFLYTLRSKRGIGHVGGDVEANEMDIRAAVHTVDWVMCELIRVYHSLSLEEAQGLVDALSTRTLPLRWEVGGKKRILKLGLQARDKVLVFAYTDVQGGILTEDLFSWAEYSDLSMFKRSVLAPLHKAKLIEYDRESELVYISPLGIQQVEEKILPE